jgi:hypothetical protein
MSPHLAHRVGGRRSITGENVPLIEAATTEHAIPGYIARSACLRRQLRVATAHAAAVALGRFEVERLIRRVRDYSLETSGAPHAHPICARRARHGLTQPIEIGVRTGSIDSGDPCTER